MYHDGAEAREEVIEDAYKEVTENARKCVKYVYERMSVEYDYDYDLH